MSNTLQSERPAWNEQMLEELANQVGTKIYEWGQDETPVEECIEAAKKILKYHINDNGYVLAKELEDCGFEPDAELVEVLDSVWYQKHQILNKYIKQWVANSAIKLELSVGQKVIAKLSKGEKECEIVDLKNETAQYGLWYEGIGHLKGKGCVIVNCENIIQVL